MILPLHRLTNSCIKLCLTILLLAGLLTGCSTPASQVVWDTYQQEKSRVDAWAADWEQQSDAEYRSDKGILVATYASSEYKNRQSLRSTEELVSRKTPMLLAWLEYKKGDNTLPLYRYVVLPVKYIEAEELLTQGPYLASETGHGLPAHTPKKLTNGALVTDWQYCYGCFAPSPPEQLKTWQLNQIEGEVKKKLEGKYFSGLYFVNQPKQARKYSSWTIEIVSGEAAVSEQAEFSHFFSSKLGTLNKAKAGDKQYYQFWKNEVEPLLFEAFANKQGCPKKYRFEQERYESFNKSNVLYHIKNNQEYVECRTAALERYDISIYKNNLAQLLDKDTVLWEQTSKRFRNTYKSPAQVIQQAIDRIEGAVRGIEDGYDDLAQIEETQARKEQQKREAQAFSQMTWQNTLNNIKTRNDSIAQQSKNVTQMINNINRTRPQPTVRPPSSSQHDRATSDTSRSTNSHSQPATPATRDSSAQTRTAENTNEESKPQQQASSNNFVGAGRDYSLTGKSGTYYPRSISEKLAQTSLLNQASKFCGGGNKAHITWASEPVCKKSAHADEYLCTHDALVNCYENRCDKEFCGTREP